MVLLVMSPKDFASLNITAVCRNTDMVFIACPHPAKLLPFFLYNIKAMNSTDFDIYCHKLVAFNMFLCLENGDVTSFLLTFSLLIYLWKE